MSTAWNYFAVHIPSGTNAWTDSKQEAWSQAYYKVSQTSFPVPDRAAYKVEPLGLLSRVRRVLRLQHITLNAKACIYLKTVLVDVAG